jgi:uncharacterized membrane protein (UPF0136 family)
MSDTLDFEKRDVPGPVAIAGMIGIAKAIFEGGFGLIALLVAKSVDDSFGAGLLVFGILFAIASYLLLRGNRVGYYLTLALSLVGLVVGVVYLFQAGSATIGAAIVIAFFNALVLYLLLGRQSAREFFSKA